MRSKPNNSLTTYFTNISKNFPLDGHLTILIADYAYEKLNNQIICEMINDYHQAYVYCDKKKLQEILNKYGPIEYWDVSNVTILDHAFKSTIDFNYDISGWDVRNVRSMKWAFSFTENFGACTKVGNWDIGCVKDMSALLYGAKEFEADITHWDVENVTNMEGMFCCTRGFNQDLSGWNVKNVLNMRAMFCDARDFNQDISSWAIRPDTDVKFMFRCANSFNGQVVSIPECSTGGCETKIIYHREISASTCLTCV